MHAIKTILAGSLALALAACATTQTEVKQDVEQVKETVAADLNNQDLYEVHHEEDGRLYVFDDFETYQDFLSVGETTFRQTFIGEGPHGQTLVYGVTSGDKKKHYSDVAAYNMYNGNLPGTDNFYGEARLEGRIYVFDRLEDMEAVRTTGEAALRFTLIGEGPAGETVVFVLRGDNKKVKPVALIEEFKKRNGL